MKPCAIKNVVARLLLLMAMAILLAGCYWAGPPPDYPRDAPYGGYYPGYYAGDVIISVGGHHDRDDRRNEVRHMPVRRLPAPAPRPRPVQHPEPLRR